MTILPPPRHYNRARKNNNGDFRNRLQDSKQKRQLLFYVARNSLNLLADPSDNRNRKAISQCPVLISVRCRLAAISNVEIVIGKSLKSGTLYWQ